MNFEGVNKAQRVRMDFIQTRPTYKAKPLGQTSRVWIATVCKHTAHLHDLAEHDPYHPGWTDLISVLMDQFEILTHAGFTFEFVEQEEPYAGGQQLINAVEVGHVKIAKTPDGHFKRSPNVGALHPFSGRAPIGFVRPCSIKGITSINYNDVFRAVHDVLGHGAAQVGFGLLGEYMAWRSHAATMPHLDALRPLAGETLMQVGYWFTHRKFAEQKAVIAPEDLIKEDLTKCTRTLPITVLHP